MPAILKGIASVTVLVTGLFLTGFAHAADRKEVDEFLKVTGFDVALDSIVIGAEDAPMILGMDPGEFGIIWRNMVRDVMDGQEIRETAVQMLEQTLDQDMLDHALGFYRSDLGHRLVLAENASHMERGDDGKDEAGRAIVDALVRSGKDGQARLAYFKRMNDAIDADETSLRAVQEIQVRFLLAAAAYGVVQLKLDEPDLRELFRRQEPQMRAALLANAITGAAYTYQAFDDDELRAYAEALEEGQMRKVYALMNAVHYQIMANRFEMLAARMAALRPSEEL